MTDIRIAPVPVIVVCHNGLSMGFPPTKNDHVRAPRGNTQGWTNTATRSNRRFLWSVNCPDLGSNGHSFTLTIRDCPATSAEWAALRRAFQKRMDRLGAIRMHWLTEWQRRGVPHLHGCVWFPDGVPGAVILQHWLAITEDTYGATVRGQNTKPIVDAVGWLKYLAKHADRGVYNYQRAVDSIPEGWKGSTGRMWGHTGDWPVVAPLKLVVSREGLFALRRIAQRWRLAQSRADMDESNRRRRIRSARRMLQSSKRTVATVRGAAEWLPKSASKAAILHLAASGYEFTWAEDKAEPDSETLPGFEVDPAPAADSVQTL